MFSIIKPTLKSEWLPLSLIVLSVAWGIYLSFNLPEIVPSHWNFQGEVDGYSSRTFGAWFMPGLMAAMYILFWLLPYFDPKRAEYAKFANAFHGIKNYFIVFVFIMALAIGAAGLGYTVPIGTIMPILVGFLFIVIGYYLKFIKQNWLIGVRTPWTMESKAVWEKTNQLMSKLMMAGGALIIISSVMAAAWFKVTIFIVVIAGIVLTPFIYSLCAYRQEQRGK